MYNVYLLIRFVYLKKHQGTALNYWLHGWQTRGWKIINLVLILLLTAPIIINLVMLPKVIFPTDPAMGATEISNLAPLTVIFDRPISGSIAAPQITPDLPGKWQIERGFITGRGKMVFAPEQSPVLASRYTVSLTGIRNIWGNSESKYLFSFQTPALPEVKNISVSEGDSGVLPDQSIEFTLDKFPDKSAKIDFELSPPLELNVSFIDGKYIVKPKESYQKGRGYKLTVFRTLQIYDYRKGTAREAGEKTEIKALNFKIVEAPSVNSTSPNGSGVLTGSNISVEFKQDMDRQSTQDSFSVTPPISGNFTWENSRKVIFDPSQDLAKNANYKIIISKNAKTADGQILSEDVTFSFTTIGFVMASKFSPANGATNVANDAAVSVTFNQAVDHASAEGKFSISPSITGSFGWSGDTLTFQHSEFASNTKYTIEFAGGVKTINGLDSKDKFSTAFTTKIPSTSITVPSYKQAHMYSCMAVAARNALAYKGVHVSESAVLSAIGYDSTAWSGTWASEGAVWGDPDSGIVGSVDGKANNIGWGYGSHWGPVAAAINGFGRTAEVKSGWDVAGIAAEIAAGNPVIVWWVNGVWPAFVVNWKTPGGKSVRAVNAMHVQVVKGFTGTADNPLSFTVTDSGYGYPAQTFDTGTFKAKWGWFGNTAVIVR